MVKTMLAAICTLALLGTAQPAMAKTRTAKSIECSKQADTQNSHGKARKVFMRKCKKA